MPKGLRTWSGPLLIAAAGAAMMAWTWGTWPDAVVDFGRELYVPWQLTEGQTLYRDIAYHNGPLSPYWNSLWFHALGVSLRTLVIANTAVLALLLWLVWSAVVELGSRLSATVACLVIVGMFSFSQYIGSANNNWMCPYSHEVTHGILLAIASVHFLHLYERRGPLRFVVLSGLCAGLCCLTKVEVAVACLAGAGTGLVALQCRARRWAAVGAWVTSCLLPIAAAAALLALRLPPVEAVRCAFGAFRYVAGVGPAGRYYFLANMGLAAPGESLRRVLMGLAAYGALVAAVPLARRLRIGPVVACVAVVGVFAFLQMRVNWAIIAAPWPILLVGLALWTVWHDRSPFRLAWIVLSLALLGKILFRVRVSHYGFGLALPAAVVMVVALIDWLPAWTERSGSPPVARALATAAWVCVIALHLSLTAPWVASKTTVVGTGADAFLADEVGMFVNAAVQEISLHPGTLTSVIDAEMINYLARRRNPLRYGNFNPHQVATFGEEAMIREFEARPPDLVALVHADTSVFGVRFFGRDYAVKLADWIHAHYDVVRRIGHEPFVSDAYGIDLLARHPSAGR